MVQVNWSPPPCGWIKVNSDGAAKGQHGPAGGGVIFRDKSGAILGCFAEFYGNTDSFNVEVLAAMHAIEVAHNNGWHKLWLFKPSILQKLFLGNFRTSGKLPSANIINAF